jgi:prepilin-type N-terminal cleavage/methylation domain-containing protein
MKHNIKNGFTLVEVLLSITLFSFFMIIVVSSQNIFTRIQIQTDEKRYIIGETKNIFMKIEPFIRGLYLDTSCYENRIFCQIDQTGKTHTLALRNIDPNTYKFGNIRYLWKLEKDSDNKGHIVFDVMKKNSLGTWDLITQEEMDRNFSPYKIDITNFDLWINTSQQEISRVTLLISTRKKDNTLFTLQTTAIPRNQNIL